MTNEMPVVGKRYKAKIIDPKKTIIIDKIYDAEDGKRFNYTYNLEKYTSLLSSFWEKYEKLPEDDLQEVNKAEVNETPNPVDLEKKEVNEVERALEELKKELFNKRDCHFTRIDKLENLAQRLIDVLEAEKNMSKPEPKIDMKEERVEPVSIWKDVDELKELENQNEKFLIRTKDGRVLMLILSNIFTDDNEINKNIKEATTLTDFVNTFEQMQKDIEELKKSGK